MSRESLQHQQSEHQSLTDSLHQQLRDTATQLSTSAASVDRLSASLSQQTDRAEELQRRLEHAETQLKTKVIISSLCITVFVVPV